MKRSLAERLLEKIKKLQKKAMYEKSRTKSIPKDILRNRCLRHIEAIQSLTHIKEGHRKRILDQAWTVYLQLADLPGPERADYDAEREVPLHMVDKESIVVQMQAPNVRRGGRGYAQITWGKGISIGSKHSKAVVGNQFWNPTSGKRDKRGVLLDLADSDYWVFKESKCKT